jgi:3-octaprenyl-4-hydroxybenzoate carboxy-lyase
LPYQDFHEFLDALREAGELIEVDRAVSPELEVAKAMRKSAAVSGPAIIFKNSGTAFPVVGGVYNTRTKALIAFQTTEKDAFERGLHGMATRISPVAVGDGPVDVPAGEVCGPAVAEQGHEFFKVADVPGWQDYNFPELRK